MEESQLKLKKAIDINEGYENDKAIYIAHKDKVDKRLGQYLMEFPEREKLKIMFLRETEGVYRFGTKRIHLKIEKGDNIFCRVGGGYIHID